MDKVIDKATDKTIDRGFFAIGLDEWRKACDLGLLPACSLLVLACGTGRDNSTTSWAANAVQNYAGVSWVRAQPAIEKLIQAGLAVNVSQTRKPRYKLKIGEERIWLPKSIVMPVRDETPPLRRIRQVQDVMLLRLYVELYYAQNLAADGGISRDVYYKAYEKKECAQFGAFSFLGFDFKSTLVAWATEVTLIHKAALTQAQINAGENPGHLFFGRMDTLISLGLLEYSVCVFESEHKDAEILFPIAGPTAIENEMGVVSHELAEANLQDWQFDDLPHEHVVALFQHQKKAQAFGVYRIRHRPQTSLTSAWWARMNQLVEQAKTSYLKLCQ